jgi:hypothetical protein
MFDSALKKERGNPSGAQARMDFCRALLSHGKRVS